jgi:molybdopterin-binding protein
MVTNESSSELELAPGKPVSAIFKASGVVLAVER